VFRARTGLRGFVAAGLSRRDAAGSTGRRVTVRLGDIGPGWSGSRPADGDGGRGGPGGRVAAGLLERLAGFGLVVAMPVAVDGDPAPADAGDHGPAGAGDDAAGQAGRCSSVPGAADGGPAGGGEGDLAGMDGLPGAAALGGRGRLAGSVPGQAAGQLGAGDPRGVLLPDEVRGSGPEHRPGRRPCAVKRGLVLAQRSL